MRNQDVVNTMYGILINERNKFQEEFDLCDPFKELARVCFLKIKLTELDSKIDTLAWVLNKTETL